MASNKRYTLKFRRRREGRTDYHKRLSMLKSRKNRLVVRKTNSNTIVQVVGYKPDGDVIIASASSSQLKKLGWEHGTANLPAAYLTGYMAGLKAKKAKVGEAIVDIGLQAPSHGGRLFAAVKGAIDAGLAVHASQDAFPPEERLTGGHINEGIKADVALLKKKAGGKE